MEMEKVYEPSRHEPGIYSLWEQSGAFQPSGDPKKDPFCIIMPPPNANGNLHTGHAMYTVEDIMVRYHRMRQQPTLWLPGTDHAGIETQLVFERELAKEGKSRFDFTPQKFFEAALAYTKRNQKNIIGQLKSLGFSADWSRLKFTLDPDIIEVVYATFRQLLDDGLVYRGSRIVNWCPTCNSSFADIEISHREQQDPLYYVKYGPLVVATVRPETKFGDTALAVHPNDERYKKYIGKDIVIKDLLGEVKLPVVADEFVNPDFGTGVIKVTPAHDPNDWELAQRHNLPAIQVIGTDGRLTEAAGKYAGMKVADARTQVAADLEAAGLIDHIDMNYHHSISYHGRCGTPIEPLITEQWWLKVEELKKPAIQAVQDGTITIIPRRFEKLYVEWLENLKDWNISRQNWFGIKIPIYYNASNDSSKAPYKMFSRENEAREYYGEGNYEAETDTFDTWFSSSQWPFATLMATGDFKQFYPTSVMETGRDILFLWVTRMVMLGIYKTGEVPFKTVYLHGLVNDERGQKMSKSRGNVINPLDKTAEFGTDALRLALTIGITPGNDGALGDNKIAGYRNFCNKLWNVARYTLEKVGERGPGAVQAKSDADHWMLATFSRENAAITDAIEHYRFSEAGERVYSLLWDSFADWYIEISKVEPNPSMLVYGLETILKLAHPFAPFVTEAIWQQIPWQGGNLITEPWPEPSKAATNALNFNYILALISRIRSITKELNLQKPTLLYAKNEHIGRNKAVIQRLARTVEVSEVERGRGLKLSGFPFDAWLDVDDATVRRYQASLEKQRDEAKQHFARLEKQLQNKSYLAKAPAPLVEETRDRAKQAKLLVSQLDEQLDALSS